MLHILLFLGTYLSGMVLSFLANPAFAFILYEAIYFFSPAERWWAYGIPEIPYSFSSVIIMTAVLLLRSGANQEIPKISAAPQFKWIYILGIVYSASWFLAVNPEGHQVAATNFVKLIIIISIAYKLIRSSRALDYVLWGYVYGAWYLSFLVYQTGRNVGDRVSGVGVVDAPDTNGVAAAIAPCLVLCLYYFWVSKNIALKFTIALAGAFIVNALILINSRGAFLAGGVSIAFFMYHMFFSSFQRKYQKATVIGITVLGLAGLLYLIDDSFIARLKTMQNTEITVEEESATTRFLFWQAAWEMAQDHPLGTGYLGFDYYSPFYIPEEVDTGALRNRSVHSTWFEILSEIGYLGLMFFLFLMFSCVRSIKQTTRSLRKRGDVDNYFKVLALAGAFLAYVVAMTFLNRFRAEILYWLILFIACAYNLYVVRNDDTTEPGTAQLIR